MRQLKTQGLVWNNLLVLGTHYGLRIEPNSSADRQVSWFSEVAEVSEHQGALATLRDHEKQSGSAVWVVLLIAPGLPGTNRECRVAWVLPDGSGITQVGRVPEASVALWNLVLSLTPPGVLWAWRAESLMNANGEIGLKVGM